MRVLVFPRDDLNPYQRLLYGEMARLGARVTYLGRLTPSHTLNVLLLPAELAARRVAGGRLVHLHWVFGFSLPGAARFPFLRRLAQLWFALWLRTVRVLGMRLVWTAHNVLPHARVFADDAAARRALVRASDLVLAHSPAVLAELAALGAAADRTAVIPHGPFGPFDPAVPGVSLRIPGSDDQVRHLLFFGRVEEYKGVDDLLAAMTSLPGDVPVRLTVAGQCDDRALRSRLRLLARTASGRVVLRLERVPEDEVTGLLAASDVVVLPFRRITTSGSAMLALTHGRPLIVPDLAALAGLPPEAVIRYDGSVPSLAAALTDAARISRPALAAMSAAATAYASSTSWPEIAARTLSEMALLLGPPAGAPGEGAHRTRQRLRAVAPRKPATATPRAGPARPVRIAVIIPAGPRDDILDTLASVVRYTDPSRVILVIDDTGALHASSAQIRELSEDIAVIPAPVTVPGVLGGLWVKVAAGYTWVLERFRPGLILRMDADALMLGSGIEAAAEKALASQPGVGMLGSWRLDPAGNPRDFTPSARILRAEEGLRGLTHPRCRSLVRRYARLARQCGYTAGEHALGAAYVHSYQAASCLYRNGWLNEPGLGPSRLADDHLMSLLTVAAGFRIADFGGPGDPMALKWRGLPAHPAELLADGKLITHSVRSWGDLSERQIRSIFAEARITPARTRRSGT
jgi:glycosyltransferase involved in cell wall biosynthesis